MPAPKIMIIRHAEKPTSTAAGVTISGSPDSDSLIVQRWQRAGALVALFDPARGPLQSTELVTPQFLFTAASSGEEGNRPQETILPLQTKLGLKPTLISKTKSDPSTGLTELANAAMACNGPVLISWPHGEIPGLTALIPVNPPSPFSANWSWPKDRFDMVFVFDLDATSGKYTFTQVPQLLLDGDSSTPIPTN